ncbi:MAG: AI-2E family transporter [Myxococcota bacterium]
MRTIRVTPLLELTLIVAIVYVARPVLAPLALAFYIAFILTPPSDALERFGVPRAITVAVMCSAALAFFIFVGAVLASQLVDLASEVHSYVAQMSSKLAQLRGGKGGSLDTLTSAVKQLTRVFENSIARAEHADPVRIVGNDDTPIERLESFLGPLLAPLTVVIIVSTLTVFVLARREDLRNRLIQLVGPQNVTLTTRTLDEAVQRISRLLLGLTYINAGYGMLIALGLTVIGVPYAILWGALAGVLRFVPYVGTWGAAALPTFVAFATTPGWFATISTVGLFLSIDILTGNFIEPVLLGRRTGVSAFALLVSVIFWTWLWGALGLVLATPLTVCASVMGRHIPQLAFLSVMLGDDPGLPPDVNFYQRVLARAGYDALRLARQTASKVGTLATFDALLVPALRLLARDIDAGILNKDAANSVTASLSEIARRVRPSSRGPTRQATTRSGVFQSVARRLSAEELPKPEVLGVGASGSTDALLVDLLTQGTAADMAVTPLPIGAPPQLAQAIIAREPRVVCIAALPPGNSVIARYLCRRIRAALPKTTVVVLLPASDHEKPAEAAARLREAGADAVAFDLKSAREALLHALGLVKE